MKKWFGILLSLVMALSLLTVPAWAAQEPGEIPLDSAHFPDDVFREYLIKRADRDHSSTLSQEEVSRVTRLDLNSSQHLEGKKIYSLKGVEYFSELQTLNAALNELTEVDLSQNNKLKIVNFDNCHLTHLILTDKPNLEKVSLQRNNMLFADFTNCPKLQNPNQQTWFYYLGCRRYSVPLSELPAGFDPNRMENLKYCSVSDGNLTISNGHNENSTFDYKCSDTITMTFMLAPGYHDPVHVPGVPATTETSGVREYWKCNICNKIFRDKNAVYELSEEDLVIPPLPNPVKLDAEHFPDVNLRNALKMCDLDQDGVLSSQEILDVTKLDLQQKSICSLEGIDTFKNLQSLDIGGNQLVTADFSGFQNMKYLNCNRNKLQTLNVAGMSQLATLRCAENELTQLDLTGCKVLSGIDCQLNNLTSLDISFLPKMADLVCYSNRLTSLQLNPGIGYLDCSANQLQQLNLSQCSVLRKLFCQDNSLLSLNMRSCPKLQSVTAHDNCLYVLDVSQSPNLTELYASNNQLKTLDVSANHMLAELECSFNPLQNLKLNPELKVLYCGGAYAVPADLSQLEQLSQVYISIPDSSYDTSLLQGFNPEKLINLQDCKMNGSTLTLDQKSDGSYVSSGCASYIRTSAEDAFSVAFLTAQIPSKPVPEGWITIDGALYYANKNGELAKNVWKEYDGQWVYLNDLGTIVTNCWAVDSYGWCYLGDDGFLVTSRWVKDSYGWCYLDAGGHLVTNCWAVDSYGWCYLDGTGHLVTDCWAIDSYGWCYLDGTGHLAVNAWIMDSYGWCYVDESGHMAANRWVMDSYGWCYLDGNGRMAVSSWATDSYGWCYLDAGGHLVTNCWAVDSYGWCYLDETGHLLKNGYAYDAQGVKFYLDETGHLA